MAKVSSPGVRTTAPSTKPSAMSMVTRWPASSDAQHGRGPGGLDPHDLGGGAEAVEATAMPDTSPPPPTGTTMTSGAAPSCSTISRAIGALAGDGGGMVEGGDHGGAGVLPRRRPPRPGRRRSSPRRSGASTRSPARARMRATFWRGRALGEEHGAAHPEMAAAPRHALGVVAGAGAHHPDGQRRGGARR